MSYRSKNIQTKSKRLLRTAPTTIGGQVPTGMTRYVTFLKIDTAMQADWNALMSTAWVYLASVGVSNPTRASVILATYRKHRVALIGSVMSRTNHPRPYMLPLEGPDPENPLFTIASGKWLGLLASHGSANVFVQWFDE